MIVASALRGTLGLVCAIATAIALLAAAPAQADFEITGFDGAALEEDGSTSTQAGAHPFEMSTTFSISSTTDTAGSLTPEENPRDIEVDLPPGLLGNPASAPKCSQAQLAAGGLHAFPPFTPDCPLDSQLGTAAIVLTLGGPEPTVLKVPVYNMQAPEGTPAQLGLNIVQYPTYINTRVRTGSDYGVTAALNGVSQATPFIGSTLTLWGVPAAAAHDDERSIECFGEFCFGAGKATSAEEVPFLTNPQHCAAGPLPSALRIDSWQNIGHFEQAGFLSHLGDGTPTGVEGCSRLPFEPSISVQPTSSRADSPTGLAVELAIPQDDSAEGLAAAYMKRAAVTLPAGLRVNPAAAAGLAGCGSAAADLHGPGAARCPNESKIGTVEIETPLVDHPISGSVFAAAQTDNPFGSLLAIYIALDDPRTGVHIKLPGRVTADPQTGQLTTVFDESPQLPFSKLSLDLFAGPRAVLRTPSACGTYTTHASFSPWSAADPANPTPAERVDVSRNLLVAYASDGGPCSGPRFDPTLSGGTADPVAGAYRPLSIQLSRADGSDELSSLAVRMPHGLLAKLAGVPYCPEDRVAAALSRGGEGLGASELAAPSCPAASQVGTVSVGAGAGPSPLYVSTGKAYLAGPYRGAPLSLVVAMPALAGPFDLGVALVRTALRVDPITAQVEAVSDPLPAVLGGIPLALRDVRVSIDRPRFALNPTSCDPMRFTGTAVSVSGLSAPLADRFQVGDCAALGFKPRLQLRLKGPSHRRAHPKLIATLRPRTGDANIAFAQVKLPSAAFLDNAHIGAVCTRVQFNAGTGNGAGCPSDSVYGRATAITPLLDYPLQGTIFLRSSDNPLPDLLVAFKGPPDQPIKFALAGRTDSVRGALRNTFEALPDVPVSRFRLELFGGRRGLIELSRNLCAHPYRASARLRGQNGKLYDTDPLLGKSCQSNRGSNRQPAHSPKPSP